MKSNPVLTLQLKIKYWSLPWQLPMLRLSTKKASELRPAMYLGTASKSEIRAAEKKFSNHSSLNGVCICLEVQILGKKNFFITKVT